MILVVAFNGHLMIILEANPYSCVMLYDANRKSMRKYLIGQVGWNKNNQYKIDPIGI